MVARVWPNQAAFPDWFSNNTTPWWDDQLTSMHEMLPFDGIWLDMNEASDFCPGSCDLRQKSNVKHPVKYNLKYVPTGRDLEISSMSLDSLQANGYTQLDTHSLFGTMESLATHEWFKKQNKRTFIIERSSFAGMGKFASKWLGDNYSD